jgi:adenylate cyclase
MRRHPNRFRWLERIVPPLLLVAAAVAVLADPAPLANLRETVFDTYQRMHPRPRTPSPVRLIDVDDASLARIGQWPWPRDRLASMINRLHRDGARVIALDLLLVEPDRSSPRRLLAEHLPATERQAITERLPDTDEVLAKAIRGAPVVVGFAMIDESNDARPLRQARINADPDPPIGTFPGAVVSLPIIGDVASGTGALNVGISGSGAVRRLPILLKLDDVIFPSLVAEALRVAQRLDEITVATGAAARIASIDIGALSIPADTDGQLRLYFAFQDPLSVIPAWRILTGEYAPESVRNAIVVIGAGATGLQDRHPTPLSAAMPGPLIHVQALEQILSQIYLRRPDWAKGAEVLLLLGLGFALLLVVRRAGPAVGAAVGFGATVMAIAVSWFAFVEARLLLDPVLPSIAVFTVFLGASIIRHMQAERQQRWIRRAFASYVAPGIVDQLVRRPDQLALGGERRELSCLFTDLEGFTSLVEEHEPARVVPVLNDYLDGLVRVAFRFEGTVDKIIGDAIHVIFGAPVAMPDHCQRAVACALALDAFARAFAARQQDGGLPFGRTRIGVNSGIAIVGNFGGALRFDYTAHGDVVNTAARLEGANKYLGTNILVSAATASGCPGFHGRPAGELLLKGKSRPVTVFEPLPDAVDGTALTSYAEAYARMAAGDIAAAIDAFARLDAAFAGDPLVRFHLERLRRGETGTAIRLAEK